MAALSSEWMPAWLIAKFNKRLKRLPSKAPAIDEASHTPFSKPLSGQERSLATGVPDLRGRVCKIFGRWRGDEGGLHVWLHKVAAGVELIFRIVDKADNVVPILTGFVFLMEIDFAAVINGRSVSIRDDFDKGMFPVSRIGGRL